MKKRSKSKVRLPPEKIEFLLFDVVGTGRSTRVRFLRVNR